MREFELVVPAYNEGASIEALIDRTLRVAKKWGHTAKTFRLVVVDNGSTDQTPEVLAQVQQSPRGHWLQVVRVEENQGYGHGLWQGLLATRAPYVGFTHADLQCDPQDAFAAVTLVKKSKKPILVKGKRHGRDWKEQVVSRAFEGVAMTVLGLHMGEINAQPKVFSRELLQHLSDPPKSFAFDLYVLYQAKKNNWGIDTIQVAFPPRVHGASHWASSLMGRSKTIAHMVGYMVKLKQREGRL